MGMIAEGTLYIEMATVREWVSAVFPGRVLKRIKYHPSHIVLSVLFEGEEDDYEIDPEPFWFWVNEHLMPQGLRYMESVFGVPKFGDHDMELTFAVSSISWPGEWSPPPACLAEWVTT